MGIENDNASGALIESNEIANNNFDGFSVAWAAGGIKSANAQNETVRGNYIHDNLGDGLWCDGACSGGLYENNLIVNNSNNGIAHEISHAWTITNNVIIANGFGTGQMGLGIILNESDNVQIYSNFVANNYKGIVLNMSPRNDCTINGVPFTCDLNNDYVHDNTVVQSSGVAAALYQNVDNDSYYTNKNNRFASNNYCLGTSLPTQIYWWLDNYNSQSHWVGYGQDVTGTWLCPEVFISSPNNGSTVSGTIALTAVASDISAVTAVNLYVDGTQVTPSTTKTYTNSVTSTQAALGATYNWNTTQMSNGSHTLQATTYNIGGQSSTASLTVTVQNP
jgi:hypothetical protein